jgi:hypothetical protein
MLACSQDWVSAGEKKKLRAGLIMSSHSPHANGLTLDGAQRFLKRAQ